MIKLDNYKTIAGLTVSEFKEKKSKFIGYIKHVTTKEDAEAFINEIKKKHHDARHNVPVYILGEDSKIQKYSDDGEPSGTAGMPILDMLKNEGITNIVAVVTRYFGGVKLGTGGLVRAYTKSVKLALESTDILENRKYISVSFDIDYVLHGKITNYIENNEDVKLDDSIFTDKITIKVFVKPEKFDKIEKELINISSGKIKLNRLKDIYLTVKV